MNTNREKAKAFIKAMSENDLNSMIVEGHETNSHKWVECFPDGSIHNTEEADNNTTHWIDYPRKAVAIIYNIANESAEPCNCDICSMYRRFRSEDIEDFIADYSEEDWKYCNDNSQEQAILDNEADCGTNYETIREKLLDAIDEIDYGYFSDEFTDKN